MTKASVDLQILSKNLIPWWKVYNLPWCIGRNRVEYESAEAVQEQNNFASQD
jgi:hypothetical protein